MHPSGDDHGMTGWSKPSYFANPNCLSKDCESKYLRSSTIRPLESIRTNSAPVQLTLLLVAGIDPEDPSIEPVCVPEILNSITPSLSLVIVSGFHNGHRESRQKRRIQVPHYCVLAPQWLWVYWVISHCIL